MGNRLTGKIALVTGGAKGIGKGTAERFLEEDVEKVILVDMDIELAEKTAKELDPTGTKVFAYQCNVGDFDNVTEAFKKILDDHQRVDILVNSAGITRDRTLIKMSLEEWKAVIDVDLSSLFYVCKQICPGMKERAYGKIVNLSSAGFLGGFGQTNYSAAKAGVIGFTRALASEMAKYNVTVNAVCPAAVDTDMIHAMPPEILQQRMNLFPRKRCATVRELADVILFLSSDESSFVNGEKILVTDARIKQ